MAMVHQLPEGDTTNRDSLEENQSHTSEEPSSRPSSRSSARSRRSTPGPLPEFQYSKDELLKLSKLPYTRKRPPCLDPAYNNTSGKWDPERWFISKRGDRSLEEPRSKRERGDSDIISHKRRTSDPKERVREERDDIVLSPQRRSFGTGCHVIQQSSLARRPGSPVDNRESESSFREPSRRIGSGRIITRDRDQRDWDHDHRERDYGYGGRGHRYDQDDDKEGRRYSHRYNRGDRRFYRGRSDDRIEEEEPEWFSGGPTSQSETIELVGFDDIPNDFDSKKISKKTTGKKIRDFSHRQNSASEDGEKIESLDDHTNSRGNRNLVEDDVAAEIERSSTPDGNLLPNSQPEKQEFDLDDIFKMDWFPGLIPNGTPPDRTTQEMGCSRFSQWFKRDRDSPVLGIQGSGENSRRSSLQDELIAHVLNGIGEPQLVFPSSPPGNSSDSYFTPISPALPHSSHSFTSSAHHNAEGGKNILEILQNANSNNDPIINGEDAKSFKDKELNGHTKSVEELEADLKRLVLGGKTKTQEEDRSAFNKLLRHLADTTSPPSSISIGPLDKSKVLQEEDLLQNILGRATPSPPPCHPSQILDDEERGMAHDIPDLGRPHPHSIQPDIFSQLLQQQQRQQHNVQGLTVDMLAKLLGAHPSGTPPQPSLSPTSVTNVPHHPSAPNSLHSAFSNRNDQHSLAALLQQQRQRELLSSLLKQQQHQHQHHPQPPVLSQPPLIQHRPPSSQEIGPLGIPPVAGGLSPRQSPLPADTIGPTLQGRIPSPLVFGQQPPALSHAPAPIHPAHLAQAITQNSAATSNTLQVQTPLVLPRVPSPQELAVHTQSILQNALIKRKLEEQKENFRKRQEAQRSPYSTWETGTSSFLQDCIGESGESRTRSPNVTVNNSKNASNSSPPKGLSPTMAAFTPTSVMRKMHSEKLDKESQSKPDSIQGTGVRALGSQECKLLESVNAGSKVATSNLIASSVVEGNNVANPSQQCSNIILSHGSTGAISGTFGPRPLHGQGIGNQTRPQNQSTTNAPAIIIPGQGRPIVKGGSLQINASGESIVRGAIGTKAGIPHNKHFLAGNPPGHLLHHDMNSGLDSVAKLMEQRLLQQQAAALAAQRQLNNSPMPPISPATFGLGPRGPAITPHHAGLVRPGTLNIGSTVGTPNLNLPLLRTVMQANLNNPALRAQASSLNQLTQFSQLTAIQQQLQRGGLDSRQLQALAQTRGLHPVALQQLLINAQTQAAAAAAAVTAAQVQAGMAGGRGDGKHQHLVPGQPSTNRQSPVNLAKWFGNDVLKQKMPDMPPVPHQNALLVEEVERQQQQSAAVHN